MTVRNVNTTRKIYEIMKSVNAEINKEVSSCITHDFKKEYCKIHEVN